MGILIDGAVIIIGGLFGNLFKHRIKSYDVNILGYIIMLLGLVGILENILVISDAGIESPYSIIIIFSLIAGYMLGNGLHLDQRIHSINIEGGNNFIQGLVFGSIFFGVGGLQIAGPIALALNSDNSQLFVKSIVDFPFAVMFGAIYGAGICLSSLVVVGIQVLIAITAFCSRVLLDNAVICQILSIGYIILFLSGLNMVYKESKIKTINLLPSIIFVILYNVIRNRMVIP